jgi:Bacterial inner membrane protein
VVTLLGWIGALFALLAYAQTRVTRFRQIALLSSIALLTFNVLLGIWSNVALELALAIVNLRRLVQLRGPARRPAVLRHVPGMLGQEVG